MDVEHFAGCGEGSLCERVDVIILSNGKLPEGLYLS